MSGGSFNYVSIMDIDGPSEAHEEIIAALAEYPGSDAAVAKARAALAKWREVQAEWDDLRDILKAVEWVQSGDWGPEAVQEALKGKKV